MSQAKRIALVVSAVSGAELKAGDSDAARVFQVFIDRELGCCDPGRTKLFQRCPNQREFEDRFRGLLAGWNTSDQFLLYFSGHGVERGGVYCLCFGAEEKTYLPFSNVLTEFRLNGVNRAIIVLDSCQSGAALKPGQKAAAKTQVANSEEIPKGIAIITSCRPNEHSHETDDQSESVFTSLFCDAITTGLSKTRTPDGRISVSDLVDWVNKRLRDDKKYSNYEQTSQYGIEGAERQLWIALNKSGKTGEEVPPIARRPVRSIEELRLAYEQTARSRHPCPGATLDHLNWELVSAHARIENPRLLASDDHALIIRELGLCSPIPVGETELLHKAAVLCFCDQPTRFFPQATAAFTAGNRASKSFKRVTVAGPLNQQIEQLVELTLGSLGQISRFGKGGHRSDGPEVPEEVVRELVSNAIVHRNYEASGRTQVNVTTDAIEVHSPGGFPPGRNWENLIQGPFISDPTDEAIALYVANLVGAERVGRGFSVFREYLDHNGPESLTCVVVPGKHPTVVISIRRLLLGQATFPVPSIPAPTSGTPSNVEPGVAARTGRGEILPAPVSLTAKDESKMAGRSACAADVSRIIKYAPAELIGREDELNLLRNSWSTAQQDEKGRSHIITFVALGGEGKTSLVAKWAAELAAQDWPGCDAAFAWSFYSQGTREQQAASSDLFLKAALTFFGDDADRAFAASPAGAFEKGQRLARLVGQRRSLLILDGLEPLQYAPSAPTPGELKDQGLAALLKGLAAASHGLCVVTTRYSLSDLRAFWQTTAPEVKLLRLSRDAGVHLLRTLGVNGRENEFQTLVEDVKGHALTLTLLGGFLKRAFHGDIRQRDRVKFEKADERMDGGHAFRTMAAYERWLMSGGDEGKREVAVLRLMGLFDRPADAGSLAALRTETIRGLTEPLAGLADEDWEYCLSGLETARLLTVNRDASGTLISIDAHPHLREYFAKQLREQRPDAWRAAHRRLYEHLCASTKEGDQPTLEDLQPLYQAVAHGCQAGLHQQAVQNVYLTRIRRGNEDYPARKLGAFGSNLGAIGCFFDQPWRSVSRDLAERDQAWLQNEVAYTLRSLGRLTESIEPMRAGLEMGVNQQNWHTATARAGNLSELELTLGEVTGAVRDAEQAVTYADRSGEWVHRTTKRTTDADSLHQAGRRAEAEARFREAETLQAEHQPDYPLLYSLPGFRFCDLLLAGAERAAWKQMLQVATEPLGVTRRPSGDKSISPTEMSEHIESCRAVLQRVAKTLQWSQIAGQGSLLDISLDHLTLGRATLYEAIFGGRDDRFAGSQADQRRGLAATLETARRELEAAVSGLRRAATQDHLPRGLLTRSWLRFLTGACTGPESAQADLDEAWEIAERGPMRLFMADTLLSRARLFGSPKSETRSQKYPWESPLADLATARKLIEQCGYWRRKEELEDAERLIGA